LVVGGGFLEGELDVDEGGEGLHGAVVLGVLEEIADAGLEGGVPVEYVELAVEEGLVVRGDQYGVGVGIWGGPGRGGWP
jgi:hypothetical protein